MAPAQGKRGARGKGREQLEVLARGRPLLEIELKRAHGGFSEGKRRRPSVTISAGCARDHFAVTLARGRQSLLDALARRRAATESMGGEKGRRGVSFDPPESGSRGAGRVGCKPNDVLRRLGLVRSGGEHLTEVLEGRLAAFAPAVAADRLPVESHGDPDVGRGQATKHSSLLRDLQPRAIEL